MFHNSFSLAMLHAEMAASCKVVVFPLSLSVVSLATDPHSAPPLSSFFLSPSLTDL